MSVVKMAEEILSMRDEIEGLRMRAERAEEIALGLYSAGVDVPRDVAVRRAKHWTTQANFLREGDPEMYARVCARIR